MPDQEHYTDFILEEWICFFGEGEYIVFYGYVNVIELKGYGNEQIYAA
jgi:hypothetical protein